MSDSNVYRRFRTDTKLRSDLVLRSANYCNIKQQCGGCAYINDEYTQSFDSKATAGLAAIESLGVKPYSFTAHPAQKIFGYRAHAKLAVRAANPGSEKKYAVGLFKPGTHEVVDMAHCPVHMPEINSLLNDVREILETTESLEPYNEETRSGDLRYIAVRGAHLTGQLMLTFVVVDEQRAKRPLKSVCDKLRKLPHKISSVYLNVQPDSGNLVFGERSVLLQGTRRLRDGICGLGFELEPTSFMQINPWTAEVMYRRIESIVGNPRQQKSAWDLYSGLGQISSVLARNGYRVLGIESNPKAVEDAKHNLNLNEIGPQVEFVSGKTEESLQEIPDWALNPELVVANPSRHGIHESVLDFISDRLVKGSMMVYMSCEVKTLARDLRYLCQERGFKLKQVECYDMFPFTEDSEWLAVLQA